MVASKVDGPTTIKGADTVILWDAATGDSRLRLGGKGSAVAFSPDSRFLATARGSDIHHGGALLGTRGAIAGDGRLRLWEVATGQEVLHGPADHLPTVLTFSPDGRTLAAGTKDGAVFLWDIAPQPEAGHTRRDQLARVDFDRLWAALGGDDAAAAYRAIWELRSAGNRAVRALKESLQAPPIDDPRLHQLVSDLDAEGFAVREAAFKELERRGADAEPALCKALQQAPSSAARQRIHALLGAPGIVRHPDPEARLRALAVLEAIGSSEARELLQALAQGSPLAPQTQHARAALQRWSRRPGVSEE